MEQIPLGSIIKNCVGDAAKSFAVCELARCGKYLHGEINATSGGYKRGAKADDLAGWRHVAYREVGPLRRSSKLLTCLISQLNPYN